MSSLGGIRRQPAKVRAVEGGDDWREDGTR